MFKRQLHVAGRTIEVQTHDRPHLDEILALGLVGRYATPAWLDRHCPSGVLQIGIGGGQYDEHPDHSSGNGRKPDKTAALLIAESLGISREWLWSNILHHAARQDLHGTAVREDLATFVKQYNDDSYYRGIDRDELIVNWALVGLNALLPAELTRTTVVTPSPFAVPEMIPKVRARFDDSVAVAWEKFYVTAKAEIAAAFKSALDEVRANGRTFSVTTGTRGAMMCVITSGNPFVSRAYRSRELGPGLKDRFKVLLQFDPNGRFFVTARKTSGLRLTDVAEQLRRLVYTAKDALPLSREALRSEGRLPGATELYYHPGLGSVMNGSTTSPNVPLVGEGRLLTEAQVIEAIIAGLKDELAQK